MNIQSEIQEIMDGNPSLTYKQIAKKLNIHISTVYRHAPKGRPQVTAAEVRILRRMYSIRKTATILGISKNMVFRVERQ